MRHKLFLAGGESVPEITLSGVSGLSTLPPGRDNAHLVALSHTLRIRQAFVWRNYFPPKSTIARSRGNCPLRGLGVGANALLKSPSTLVE
jgi:hypothetical protein